MNKNKKILILAGMLIAIGLAIFWYARSPKEEINYSISQNYLSGAYAYENKNKDFTVSFLEKEDKSQPWVNFESGNNSLKMALEETADLSLPGQRKELSAKVKSVKEENQKKDKLTIEEVLPGTDITYEVIDHGIKEDIVLKDKKALESKLAKDKKQNKDKKGQENQDLEYKFIIESDNVEPRKRLEGTYGTEFQNKESKEYAFHFLQPVMIDAKGIKSEEVLIEVKDVENNDKDKQYEVIIKPSLKWLEDSNRAYPVRIDPSIVHDTEGEFDAGTALNRVESVAGPKVELSKNELQADANTVALWHMNETRDDSCSDGKDACDSASGGINGTNSGTVIVDGRFGNARKFNGSSDYIDIQNSALMSNRTVFTIEMWIKKDRDVAKDMLIYSENDSGGIIFGLSLSSSNKIGFGSKINSTTWVQLPGNTTMSLGTWHHVAVTMGSSQVKIYLDGVLDGTVSNSSASVGGVIKSTIGRLTNAGIDEFFEGTIDEVRFSSVARSAAEIKADALKTPATDGTYTSSILDMGSSSSVINSIQWQENGVRTGDGETPYSTIGLVAQWNFNEISGTTAASSAGSCGSTCNGTLTNFAAGATAGQDGVADSGWTANNKKWGTGALMFDGSDDYVSVGDQDALDFGTGDFTIEAWVNSEMPQATDKWPVIISKEGGTSRTGYNLMLSGGGGYTPNTYFEIWYNGSPYSVNGGVNIRDGKWHYVVGVKTATELKMYVDGRLGGINSHNLGNISNAVEFDIGSRKADLSGNIFGGRIDSVRIYNRAITDNEILSNYQAGNIEIQTRTGNDTTPEDGGWEDWKPAGTGTETQVDAMDSASNWTADNVYTNKSDSSVIKEEGTNSFHIDANNYRLDPSVNYAAGKSYTTNPSPSGSYPDSSGKELTDGYLSGGWSDGKSFGFENVDSSITLDLGSSTSINQVNVHFGTGTYPGVYFPSSATVYTSTDNSNYSNQGTLSCPSNTANESAGWCTGSFSVTSARYVKVDVVRGGAWTMWSEMQVLNTQPVNDAIIRANWHMEETGGTGAYIKDSSGNENDGTPTGTSVTDGIIGKARSFNGSESIDFGTGLNTALRSPFTMEAWVYPTKFDSYDPILASGIAGIERYSTGGMALWVNDGSWKNTHASYDIPLNAWSQVVGVYDGSSIKIYINGVQSGTTTSVGTPVTSSQSVTVGRNPAADCGSDPGRCWDGKIDEVKLLNVAISDSTIAENYRLGRERRISRTTSSTDLSNKTKVPFYVAADKPGTVLDVTIGESAYANCEKDNSTVGLWHLEEKDNSGEYLKDSSGNNNNLAATGITSWVEGKMGKGRYFNGSSYLEDSNFTPNLSSQLTVSFWYKPTNLDAYYHKILILGNASSNLGLYFSEGDAAYPLYFGLYNSSSSAKEVVSPRLSTNEWHHLAGTYDVSSGLIQLYVDGQLKGTNTLGGQLKVQTPLRMGWGYGSEYFTGSLDEVRIDNVVRSAADIRQAYEIGQRTHSVTVDFAASLDAGNLISDSGDTSFTINSQTYGAINKGDNLYAGEKVIVKENYDGTQYLAQGTVADVNVSTGAVNVASWDAGSTFPSVGYSVNATVFKWQREYWDISHIPVTQRDGSATVFTLKTTDGSVGRNIYIDDIESTSNYLTNPSVTSNITSGANRYFQYRAFLSTSDTLVTPYLSSVSLLYDLQPPTNVSATDGTYQDKVVVSWTKSTNAASYRVYRDGIDVSGALGDVSSYDDTGAGAFAVDAGAAQASDGTSKTQISLSLSGQQVTTSSHIYTVVALDNYDNASTESSSDTGYRALDGQTHTLTYQWQRSADNTDANYSNLTGATTVTYNDTEQFQGQRYYRCVVSSVGAQSATSASDPGHQKLDTAPVEIRNNTIFRKRIEIK